VLLEALSKYIGTVVFVSHDRYFIDKLATRVFEIGGGQVEIYPGNYEDFLWRKQGGAEKLQQQVAASTKKAAPSNGNAVANAVTHAPSEDKSAKRLNPIRRKQMQDRAQELEEQISGLERTIASSNKIAPSCSNESPSGSSSARSCAEPRVPSKTAEPSTPPATIVA
jgi:ATP-binding cassette subfamily F protein 3